MDVNAQNMRSIYTAISTVFNEQFAATKTFYPSVAMTVLSTTAGNEYPRMDDLPGMREWFGDRVAHSLSAQTYTIKNRKFETTVSLLRDQVEDDQIGFFKTMVAQLAQDAAAFPDQLVFPLFKNGDKERCYDKQYFFDTDHPGYNDEGGETSVSNLMKGDKPAWYLVDDSKVIKPMVFQQRKAFKLTAKDKDTDSNVFEKDAFVYGVDGRCNAGFGLWQLALKATVELTAENYEKARQSMSTIRKRNGQVIDIRPTKLLVPSALEGVARKILNADLINGGETNIWKGTAEVEVIPLLA